MPESRTTPETSPTWADRGWYLAIEYGVLARERFLRRLPEIRKLGRFKELLEPGGQILYRNLFREQDIQAAWELLTALRPWHDHLVCYLAGEQVGIKLVHDVLWCAAFLKKEHPCRGGGTNKSLPVGCDGARVLLGPGRWDEASETTRHAMTFSRVNEVGQLCFDGEAIAAFIGQGTKAQACPASLAGNPQAVAAAFHDVSVLGLGWPLAAELSADARKAAGKKALEGEHGFFLKKGLGDLHAHAPLELRARGQTVEVRLASDLDGPSIAQDVRIPVALLRVLQDGVRVRAVRISEEYVRLKGGHYDLEQRFVISTRVRLGPTDHPDRFGGYELSTIPRATEAYSAWAQATLSRLP
jgi:hypothetical protein